jgi:two-component system sensor histidine kinase RegB
LSQPDFTGIDAGDDKHLQAAIIRPVNSLHRPGRTPFSPSLTNLRSLLAIRAIALLGQAGVLAYVYAVDRATQGLGGLALGWIALALLTVISLWRTTQPWPVKQREFLLQLLVDVVGWTVLMYFSGGADNPFVSYYIVPLAIAAAVLPWRFAWLVTAVSLAAYSSLFFWYRPFPLFSPHTGMAHGAAFSVHTLGMWFNFLFSAGLITYFVVRMATVLRQQEERETRRREAGLRNDQIMAVASLAAGTAHELATPLSTMTVLVDELLQNETLGDSARADCELLQGQLRQCRNTLAALSRTAETSSVGELQRAPARQVVQSAVERWALQRPRVTLQFDCRQDGPAPALAFDPTLQQAIENLLNNAADTGSQRIAVSLAWGKVSVCLEVRDWGPGVPPELLRTLHSGDRFSDRFGDTGGLGIGLLLCSAAVERHGGHLELRNAADGGTIARVTLPLSAPTTAEVAL